MSVYLLKQLTVYSKLTKLYSYTAIEKILYMFESKYNFVLQPYACTRIMTIQHTTINNNFNSPSLN